MSIGVAVLKTLSCRTEPAIRCCHPGFLSFSHRSYEATPSWGRNPSSAGSEMLLEAAQ